MANEIKTVTNLTAAQDKIKTLTKEVKELKAMVIYCKKQMDQKDAKIKRLEKSLLSAVTNLEWEK
jgi:predicted  nucleic acid-binding Zn-ribbon protein